MQKQENGKRKGERKRKQKEKEKEITDDIPGMALMASDFK